MKDILLYFKRRPQSRLALVRFIVYIAFSIFLKTALDQNTVILLLAALLGVGDLGLTGVGERQTTPVGDPKLGAGKEMPATLKAAALAVQAFLPGPIGELFERYGVEGLWALVKTAENASKRQLTESEMDAALDEQVKAR